MRPFDRIARLSHDVDEPFIDRDVSHLALTHSRLPFSHHGFIAVREMALTRTPTHRPPSSWLGTFRACLCPNCSHISKFSNHMHPSLPTTAVTAWPGRRQMHTFRTAALYRAKCPALRPGTMTCIALKRLHWRRQVPCPLQKSGSCPGQGSAPERICRPHLSGREPDGTFWSSEALRIGIFKGPWDTVLLGTCVMMTTSDSLS